MNNRHSYIHFKYVTLGHFSNVGLIVDGLLLVAGHGHLLPGVEIPVRHHGHDDAQHGVNREGSEVAAGQRCPPDQSEARMRTALLSTNESSPRLVAEGGAVGGEGPQGRGQVHTQLEPVLVGVGLVVVEQRVPGHIIKHR